MADGYRQLGATLAGGGALPAAYAEAQGESLGANTQAAIALAQERLAKNDALRRIGDVTPTFASADQDPQKLGAALALAAQAGVKPEELTAGVHGNQLNNSYATIVNPETPDAIVARHLAAEGKETGIIRPTAAGEAATNILHPEQGVTTTPLGQALIPAKAGLMQAQADAAHGTADLHHAQAALPGGGGKGPTPYQWASNEDGTPKLDENGNRVAVFTTGGPKDPNSAQPMGAVTSRYFQNSMNAGLQGATALANIVRAPSTSTAGLFADIKAGHTPIEALVRNATTAITPEEDKNLNTMLSGLSQNLAIVDNSGRVANQAYVDAMDRVKLLPGDTMANRFLKLAEARQVLENGLQSWNDTASLNDQQKAALQRNIATIQKAIPFTVEDVQGALAHTKAAPEPTIADKFRSFLGIQPAGGAAPGATGATTPAPAGVAPTSPGPAAPPALSFQNEAQFNEAVARGKVPNGTRVSVGGRTATWTEE
jgi:hypothetical protein